MEYKIRLHNCALSTWQVASFSFLLLFFVFFFTLHLRYCLSFYSTVFLIKLQHQVLGVVVQGCLVSKSECPFHEPVVFIALVHHHLLGCRQQFHTPLALLPMLDKSAVIVVVPVLVALLPVAIPQPNGGVLIPDLHIQAILLAM